MNQLPFLTNNSLTFLFRETGGKKVYLHTELSGKKLEMRETGKSGLYTLTLINIPVRNFAYYFRVAGKGKKYRDPFNPDLAYIRSGRKKSFVSMFRHPIRQSGAIRLARRWIESDNPRVRSRPLYIYLPPSYFSGAKKRYPVLYMQDGRGLWQKHFTGNPGWAVNSTADRMIKESRIREIIIVGIPHSGRQRLLEYSLPFFSPGIYRRYSTKKKGYGDLYGQFLIQKIKPFIDKNYRTLPDRANTAIAGSSMGAVISLYLGYEFNSVFSRAGLISPAFYFNYRKRGTYFSQSDTIQQKKALYIYMDTGDSGPGRDGLYCTRRMRARLIRCGWSPGRDLFYYEHPGGRHSKNSWRIRFHRMLSAFYSTK